MEFGFEIDAAAGAQVGGKLCGVDRIAVVVTGTVGDERDERTAGAALGRWTARKARR
jgi:hypothetical protein